MITRVTPGGVTLRTMRGTMDFDSKLIPVLREGADVVKMIFFRKLKESLAEKYPEKDSSYIGRLSGAIINELFGVENRAEPFAAFTKENRRVILTEMKNIASDFEEMRIPLTDAIRIQFLCDSQEGIADDRILNQAKTLGILIIEREIPLPNHFMNLVRRLGSEFNLLQPFGVS